MPTTPQYTPITTNPFRDAYDAVVAMLRANADMQGWFPNNGQWVTLDANWIFASNPDLTDAAPADYPRIRIAYTKYSPNLEQDSCGSRPKWILEIHIWTGVQQQRLLMESIWPITRAMTKWRQYLRDVVTWNGKPCVWDVTPLEMEVEFAGSEDEKKRELTRGTSQWISVWAGEIQFALVTADLQSI